MKTTIQDQGQRLVALFEGRLDTAAATQTGEDMTPLYQCSGKEIILDCTQLDYISSSGLRLFLGVLKSAKLNNNQLYITGMNADLRNIFTMTGFINLFEFK